MKIPEAQLPEKENVTKVTMERWAGHGAGRKRGRPSLERYKIATPFSKRKVGRTGFCNIKGPNALHFWHGRVQCQVRCGDGKGQLKHVDWRSGHGGCAPGK